MIELKNKSKGFLVDYIENLIRINNQKDELLKRASDQLKYTSGQFYFNGNSEIIKEIDNCLK